MTRYFPVFLDDFRLFAAMMVFCALIVFGATNAQAQEAGSAPPPEEKTGLAQDMETLRNGTQLLMRRMNSIFGENSVPVWEGEVLVEPAGSYYAVTFPHLIVKSVDGSQSLDVGMIAMNAMRHTNATELPGLENLWSVSIAQPAVMTFSEKGKASAYFQIGSQKISGIWMPDLGIFPRAKVDLDQMGLYPAHNAGKGTKPFVTIDSVKIVQNLNPQNDAKGQSAKVSGISGGVVSRVALFDPKQPDLKIGGFETARFAQKINGLDLDKMDLLEGKTKALELYMQENTTSGKIPNLDPVFDVLVSSMSMFDSAQSEMEISALSFTPVAKDGTQQGGFAVRNIRFENEFTGQKNQERGFVRMRTEHDGLEILGASPKDGVAAQPSLFTVFSDFIPRRFVMDISLQSLPTIEEFRPAFDAIRAIAEKENAGQLTEPQKKAEMAKLMQQLLIILQKANTQIKIGDFLFDSAITDMTSTGLIEIGTAGSLPLFGVLDISLSGLDALGEKFKTEAPVNNQTMQKAQQGVMFLPILQTIGRKREGTDTYDYRIEVTEEGEILVNGKDASALSMLVSKP